MDSSSQGVDPRQPPRDDQTPTHAHATTSQTELHIDPPLQTPSSRFPAAYQSHISLPDSRPQYDLHTDGGLSGSHTIPVGQQYIPYRATYPTSPVSSTSQWPFSKDKLPGGDQPSAAAASSSHYDAPVYETPEDHESPPAYSPPSHGELPSVGQLLENGTEVRDDGRIEVDLDSKVGRTLSRLILHPPADLPTSTPPPYTLQEPWKIRLNIVVQVVGSRGDVQPFVALGNELQKHGHRVRLATHDVFEEFVRSAGLEFYPIGGDPSELMAYMVKNPGLIPSMKSLRGGDIQKKRVMIKDMLEGCWKSCIAPDTRSNDPFVADAIIANPPSFAHVHCAEALGIPVHLMFTMPWTSTRAFPHPLANIRAANTDTSVANFLSYGIVELLTWQGLGDVINKWRRSIDLDVVPATEGPLIAETLKIPFTYCWSPALVPKPADWDRHIDVCGFFFRAPPAYKPAEDLDAFLRSGPPPVYIGFGSIVLEDAARTSATILAAVRAVGTRAIVSRGWSKLDGPPDPNVFFLGDCPHEWLFQHVAAVVHHGGAGTTACGLLNARPTAVVPFFGDQPFWANMVAAAGAGPPPIPHKLLDADNLARAIRFCLTPEAAAAAGGIAEKMRAESGVERAVESFHANLPLERMKCDVLPDRPACWKVRKGKSERRVKLSSLAAEVLIAEAGLDRKGVKAHKSNPIVIENRRWDPITGGASSALGWGSDMVVATADIVVKPYQEFRRTRTDSRPASARSSPGPSRRGTADLAAPPDANSEAASKFPSRSSTNVSELPPPQGYSGDVKHPFDADEKGAATRPPSRASTAAATAGPAGEHGAAAADVNTHDRPGARFTKGKSRNTASAVAIASGKSVGHWWGTYTKGIFLDVPLAVAEGMRQTPHLYGEKVHDYGQITGWKSGAAFAAKNFGVGLAEGMSDIFVQPVKGGMKDGAMGVVKGLGKGTLGMLTKTGSAGLGVLAYTGQGVYKSVHRNRHKGTGEEVAAMRWVEGRWLLGRQTDVNRGWIIARYDGLS